LEDFRAKSEDIAIIELKKAISLNPDFHEAMNLLGIFYMYIGENDKAAEVFQKLWMRKKQRNGDEIFKRN